MPHRPNTFRIVLGLALIAASPAGLIWAAFSLYPRDPAQEIRSVSALLLGYGAGLLPLAAGMLLWETALTRRAAPLTFFPALAAFSGGALWLQRTLELFRVADQGWLPAAFLGIGAVSTFVWSGSLFIRAGRRRGATD